MIAEQPRSPLGNKIVSSSLAWNNVDDLGRSDPAGLEPSIYLDVQQGSNFQRCSECGLWKPTFAATNSLFRRRVFYTSPPMRHSLPIQVIRTPELGVGAN